jgi:hypothetical protein
MDQILPGIHHWSAFHEGIRRRVHSYYVEPAGALIDPMVPEEGLDAFAGMTTPQQALMSNRLHFRESDRFREAFGCVVRASAPGMDDLEGRDVRPFWFGDEVAPGVVAVEIGKLCPDETAFHVTHADGAIAFGDALVHPPGAPLAFVADDLMGAHPVRVKQGLKDAFRGLLLRDFDALLFAHGEPLVDGGKRRLRRFVEEPTEHPEFGPYL